MGDGFACTQWNTSVKVDPVHMRCSTHQATLELSGSGRRMTSGGQTPRLLRPGAGPGLPSGGAVERISERAWQGVASGPGQMISDAAQSVSETHQQRVGVFRERCSSLFVRGTRSSLQASSSVRDELQVSSLTPTQHYVSTQSYVFAPSRELRLKGLAALELMAQGEYSRLDQAHEHLSKFEISLVEAEMACESVKEGLLSFNGGICGSLQGMGARACTGADSVGDQRGTGCERIADDVNQLKTRRRKGESASFSQSRTLSSPPYLDVEATPGACNLDE